jgi:hypothetical protein
MSRATKDISANADCQAAVFDELATMAGLDLLLIDTN